VKDRPSGWKCKGIGFFGKCKIIMTNNSFGGDGQKHKKALIGALGV
jgi:hypothetical protein